MPATVAVKVCVPPPALTVAVPGETVTEIGAVTVTVAVAVFVGSTTLVAVTITLGFPGTVAGAVYLPVASMDP